VDWICLIVNPAYSREKECVLLNELSGVFGEDLLEMRVVREGGKVADGDYCFVQCSNYESHIVEIRSSSCVLGVLPSYEEPQLLSQNEVDIFFGHIQEDNRPQRLFRGDIVKANAGYLSGLIGIVSCVVMRNLYRVVFKFHLRGFADLLPGERLDYIDNVFQHLKSPVLVDKSGETGRIPVQKMPSDVLESIAKSRAIISEVHWCPD